MAGALSIAFRLALEGALAWALAAALLRAGPGRRLALPLAGAITAGVMVGAAAFTVARGRGLDANDVAPLLRRIAHLDAFALLAGAALLRHATAEALFAPGWRARAAEAILLAGGLVWLLPEGGFLAARFSELAVLRGARGPIALGVVAGFASAAAAGASLGWAFRRAGLARALTPSSLLALLFGLKMAGVAALAVDAHTVPAALEAVIGRAIHDGVHLAFVMFQVPDHPFLKDQAYQLILFLFDPASHAVVAAMVLALPLAAAWVAFLRRPSPPPPEGARKPERRILRAAFRRRGRLAGAAFAAGIALAAGGIAAAEARSSELYDPVAEPVADDGAGSVVVALKDPFGAQAADRMRKFVYAAGTRSITFFTMRRPDGSLAAALDLCDICQPKGYAQLGREYVFCKYCRTPIPVGSVGQAGGCNPIPIPGATVKGALLLVPRDALVAAWEKGMADKR